MRSMPVNRLATLSSKSRLPRHAPQLNQHTVIKILDTLQRQKCQQTASGREDSATKDTNLSRLRNKVFERECRPPILLVLRHEFRSYVNHNAEWNSELSIRLVDSNETIP